MPDFRFRLLFALLMSSIMGLLMTGWVSWLNLGLVADFPLRWMNAFMKAWPPAFVIVLLLAPPLQKLTRRLLQQP